MSGAHRFFSVQAHPHAEGEASAWKPDALAVEAPLELRVEGRPVAVTMRTPGHDLDLAAGFLHTEGVIEDWDDVRAMAHVVDPAAPRDNTVDTVLSSGVPAARARKADRSFFASSSCGVCGKATLDRVFQHTSPIAHPMEPDPEVLLELPEVLRAHQSTFERTGGLHAAGLFTAEGTLVCLREDVGRHNAVDKVIGARLRQDAPLAGHILLVSGRAGFEIVQKAVMAGIPVLAAVGAPSSLAAELAWRARLCLVGFLRDGRYNRYGPPWEPTEDSG